MSDTRELVLREDSIKRTLNVLEHIACSPHRPLTLTGENARHCTVSLTLFGINAKKFVEAVIRDHNLELAELTKAIDQDEDNNRAKPIDEE